MKQAMTPKDANTKQCPLAMSRQGGYSTNCRGNNCMAWRWEEEIVDYEPTNHGPGYSGKPIWGPNNKTGYCGMVG